MIGDKVIYFQHSDVYKIVHEGYSDDDDIVMVENINTAFYNMKLTHADTQKVKEEINSNKELKKMSNTANGKIIFYEDQVFDKMLDHSVKLPKLEVKISSQSEGMNKFVSSYEELRKVITEYIKIFESDVANLKEATR